MKISLNVKLKKLSGSVVTPSYAREGDAGLDLTATSIIDENDLFITYGTGVSLEIPEGYVGLLFPRSSIYKTGHVLSNSVGVIDSGYRGEIMMKFYRLKNNSWMKQYKIGDRIGQLIIMPFPRIEFKLVESLAGSERGSGGYGSTNE
tara:strand:+ start:44018 stop:44458 length:441 start_codon:yes stop_codon:yes gene_type:complete